MFYSYRFSSFGDQREVKMRCEQRVYVLVSLVITCSLYFICYKLVSDNDSGRTPTKSVKRTPALARPTEKRQQTQGDLLKNDLRLPQVANDLHRVISDLVKLQREVRQADVQYRLQSQIYQLRHVFEQLGGSDRQMGELTNQMKEVVKRKPDVCPEKYASSDLSGGYPFFYKGFDMRECKDAPPLSDIITLAFNMLTYNTSTIISILTNVQKVTHGVTMIVAVNLDLANFNSFPGLRKVTRFLKFSNSSASSEVWSSLIQEVSTRYVFVGRDIIHYSWHSRLERLIRVVQDLGVAVAAGSFRYLNGQWNYGCEQTRLKNSTLAYTKGYDMSKQECMICDVVQGPFVALTSTFKEVTLQAKMSAISGFETWFQELKLASKQVASCPDAMFFTKKQPRHIKTEWLGLVQHFKVEAIAYGGQPALTFTCIEAGISCQKINGQALSHCCLNELSDLIKTFFRFCKESGSLCEMQEGTLLGAVKFNGLLPWERDADVTFHTGNFTAIGALSEQFSKAGYSLSKLKDPWCCVDGVKAGGVYSLASNSWNMEVYGQHLMDSEKLLLEKIPPTQVEFDGQLIATPASPGLFSRNRYGHEIYQHAQHWMTLSQNSGWAFYLPGNFTKCDNPGSHMCLDQYLADGNLQFRIHYP